MAPKALLEADNDDVIAADEAEYIAMPERDDVADVLKALNPEPIDAPPTSAKVLYSQDEPLREDEPSESVVYAPKTDIAPAMSSKYEETASAGKKILYAAEIKDQIPKEPQTLRLAEDTPPNAPLPLIYDNNRANKEVAIGKAEDLNHVALGSANTPIESMSKELEKTAPQAEDTQQWQPMNSDTPWLIAKANGNSVNQMANKDFAGKTDEEIAQALNIHKDKQGVELASETVKNLIIPLPEDLANKEDLMPRLAYPANSPDAKKEKVMNARTLRQEREKEEKKLLTELEDEEPEMTMLPPADELMENTEAPKEKKGVLTSLGEMFSSAVKEAKDSAANLTNKTYSKKKARSALRKAAQAKRANITPREIKMSFQANRAEISGQTLRWVQAFALKAASEEGTFLEVRVDGTRPTILQQRRLNLLYNILTNKGVEYSKINVVFTSREPNSFILRMVSPQQNGKETTKNNNNSADNYAQW
ncbi:MAG: hypothetical protein IJ184_06140 [Alphaproteobacteria bacterium]|nr:hypothetical protein [Alphaproteobacteria bacterium]